jgi:NAD(P)-dependent dehydrogenase (short-subunit alcohol dehydrogenase family)
MIGITGYTSRIAQEFVEECRRHDSWPDLYRCRTPADYPYTGKPDWPWPDNPEASISDRREFPLDADHYLFCQGLLRPKRMQDQTEAERAEGFEANLDSIKRACDAILAVNDSARICIIGSESAYLGSYDDVYAISKMLLHSYVERKELTPLQQIVAISPGIIEDCGMTTRRTDQNTLAFRKAQHPMRRFLRAREVAQLAHHLLFYQPYIRNTVIRMNGGLK